MKPECIPAAPPPLPHSQGTSSHAPQRNLCPRWGQGGCQSREWARALLVFIQRPSLNGPAPITRAAVPTFLAPGTGLAETMFLWMGAGGRQEAEFGLKCKRCPCTRREVGDPCARGRRSFSQVWGTGRKAPCSWSLHSRNVGKISDPTSGHSNCCEG